jgi:hypothetical protein
VESDPHSELTYSAAEELGMINPRPPSRSGYDYLLILGGLATGVEPRVRYAAQLVERGLDIGQQIAALGSFRPLQQRELPLSARYASDSRYEIDHLVAMLTALFAVTRGWSTQVHGDPSRDPERASLTATSVAPSGRILTAFAAESSDPSRRPANTADTYLLLAREVGLRERERILVVTSGLYVPYQHLDAVRVLSDWGVSIETVGVPSSRSGPTHRASAYRQEVRSMLRSCEQTLFTE